MIMPVFNLSVPGYVAVSHQLGPAAFQPGLPSHTDIQFDGQPDVRAFVHFPFTVPVFFGTGPAGTATRMQVSEVFVNFYVLRTVPVSTVRVSRISVYDGLSQIFRTPLGFIDMPELAGAPPGTGGLMEPNDRFITATVAGRNFHSFGPVSVNKSLGADGGVIGFTGAGLKLTN
jgi:hypothetical protein